MDTICFKDVRSIIQRGEGVRVSIFLPTHHKGGIDPQDQIRFRNLLRMAEEKLMKKGLRSSEAKLLLAPADKLTTDNLFWRQQSDGLALFLESNQYLFYRLPIAFKEDVLVGDRYHVKPLLPLISECGWFYVLSLSRQENRLLQCTSSESVSLDLRGIPKNMPEALHYDVPGDRMQYHVPAPAGGSNFGGGTAIQAGEGSRPNYDKRNLLQYFEQVNAGLMKILQEEKAPLVLSAVDYLHPLYRNANKYPNLLPEGILGNPDGVSDDTLREQGWSIVRVYFDQTKRDALDDFQKNSGNGLTTTGIEDTVPAAAAGRVRFLFVAEGTQQKGAFDTNSNSVIKASKTQDMDEDLVDFAVQETLNHSGMVYVLPPEKIPGKVPMVATLRF